MDVTILENFLNFSVVAVCFLAGYVIKNYTKIPNKIIPLIMLILGTAINVALTIGSKDTLSFNVFLVGAISGLASTGAYELIVNMFNLKEPRKEKSEESEEEKE